MRSLRHALCGRNGFAVTQAPLYTLQAEQQTNHFIRWFTFNHSFHLVLYFLLFTLLSTLPQTIHFMQHSTSNHSLHSVLYLKLFVLFVTFKTGLWSQLSYVNYPGWKAQVNRLEGRRWLPWVPICAVNPELLVNHCWQYTRRQHTE